MGRGWPTDLEKDALAIKLLLWCGGFSDGKQFQNFFDKSIDDAWLDMPEWERDDYRFAVEMMKKELGVD